MPKIKGYDFEKLPKPTLAAALTEHGGFDPRTRKFVPMAAEHFAMHEMLDSITAAVEAGLVDVDNWPKQFFKTDGDLEAFLDELADYDSWSRITDRWWHALARLCQHDHDGAGFASAYDIAETLRDYLLEVERFRPQLEREARKTTTRSKRPASV